MYNTLLIFLLRIEYFNWKNYKDFILIWVLYYKYVYINSIREFKKYRTFFHYYNEVLYTRYPFFISLFIFNIILIFLLYLYNVQLIFFVLFNILMFLALFESIQGWFRDLILEGFYLGKYNRKIQRCIFAGVFLFLVSEAMVFIGFFWVYLDRCFHVPAMLSNVGIGIESILFYKKPFVTTFILLTSTYFVNFCYYYSLCAVHITALMVNLIGITLGFIFLMSQVFEYFHLLMCFNDSIYGSSFYLLTGFHGFHVMIGLIFLLIQHERVMDFQQNPSKMLGVNMALLYWHFVDNVWCILFVLVYIF